MKLSPSYGLYARLLKCRIGYLYLYTAIFSITGISSWWYFLYEPVLEQNEILQKTIDNLHLKRVQLALAERTFNRICHSIDIKAKIEENKSKATYAQQTLSTITHCAHAAGLNIGYCRLGKQYNKDGQIIYELHADVKGSLDQLLSFFDTVKNSKQWIEVAGCAINRVDANNFCMRSSFNVHYL